MRCAEVEARLTAYLDGELDATTSGALRGHLRGCAACAAAAEEHARLVGALARLEAAEPPAAMWDGVLAKLAEAEGADARRGRLALLGRRVWERLRPQLLPVTAVVATAAVALVWVARDPGSGADATAPAAPVVAVEPVEPVAAEPAPARAARVDVEVAIAAEVERIDRLYAATVEELLEVAGEERAAWSAPAQRAFDAELARLRGAVAARPLVLEPPAGPDILDAFDAAEAAAAAREARERAWQRLVRFLQRAALGELVAEVTR